MARAAAWPSTNDAVRLMSMIRYHSSSSSSRKSWIESAPALLTSTSRRPSPRTASSTARWQSGGLATSPTTVRASAPDAGHLGGDVGDARGVEVEQRDPGGALLREAVGGGPPDAAGSPADQRGQAFELLHACVPFHAGA